MENKKASAIALKITTDTRTLPSDEGWTAEMNEDTFERLWFEAEARRAKEKMNVEQSSAG